MENQISSFLNQYRLWIRDVELFLCSYIAIKTDNGGWALRHVWVGLENTFQLNEEVIQEFEVKTEHVHAGLISYRVQKGEALGFLEKFIQRPSPSLFEGPDYSFWGAEEQPEQPFSIHTYDDTNSSSDAGRQRMPSISLSPRGEIRTPTNAQAKYDLELKAHNPPYNGIEDLLSCWGFFPSNIFDSTRSASADIILTAPIRIIDLPEYMNGKASIIVGAQKDLDVNKATLGSFEFRADSALVRGSLPIVGLDWEVKEHCKTAKLSVDLDPKTLGRCFLSYDQEYIQNAFYGNSLALNNLLGIHDFLDANNQVEASIARAQGRELEELVALLLNLNGFNVLPYGSLMTDAADIYCYLRSGNLLMFECTTGDPDNKGKLLKLHKRASNLREREMSAASISSVLPVMVTNLSKDEVSHCVDKARTWGISLLTLEDLQDLYTNLNTPFDEMGIYQFLKARIPIKENSSFSIK